MAGIGSSSRAPPSFEDDEDSVEAIGSENHEEVREIIEVKSSDDEVTEAFGELEIDEDDPPYLTDNPRFDIVIKKSHLGIPSLLNMPKKMAKLLPRLEAQTVFRCNNKTWIVPYKQYCSCRRFDPLSWRRFATDNKLRVGDACVFELMELGDEKIKFRVLILRGDIPSELPGRI